MVIAIQEDCCKQWWNRLKDTSRRWIALAFLGCSLLIISLDNTVLNLALPSIATDLHSSASDLQWVMDAYVLSIAGFFDYWDISATVSGAN